MENKNGKELSRKGLKQTALKELGACSKSWVVLTEYEGGMKCMSSTNLEFLMRSAFCLNEKLKEVMAQEMGSKVACKKSTLPDFFGEG